MGDRIEVGGDKLAPRVLVDAQLSVLDLVVVDHPVKAHNHRWRGERDTKPRRTSEGKQGRAQAGGIDFNPKAGQVDSVGYIALPIGYTP